MFSEMGNYVFEMVGVGQFFWARILFNIKLYRNFFLLLILCRVLFSNVNGKIKILLFFLLLFWNLLSDATDLLIIIVPENAEIYIWYLRTKVPPFWLQSHLFAKKVCFSIAWKKHTLSLNDSYICVIEFGFYYIIVPLFPVFPKIIWQYILQSCKENVNIKKRQWDPELYHEPMTDNCLSIFTVILECKGNLYLAID